MTDNCTKFAAFSLTTTNLHSSRVHFGTVYQRRSKLCIALERSIVFQWWKLGKNQPTNADYVCWSKWSP